MTVLHCALSNICVTFNDNYKHFVSKRSTLEHRLEQGCTILANKYEMRTTVQSETRTS